MSRSPERAAEIRTMDKIERAMAAIDDLPEPSQARVRRWVAEVYLAGEMAAEYGEGLEAANP